jgi:hypothetical protein
MDQVRIIQAVVLHYAFDQVYGEDVIAPLG